MRRGPDKQFDEQEALSKAMTLFWKRGYQGTAMSEIVSEMGIGKKSLYDTYGNKRSLFLKALRLYSDIASEQIGGILFDSKNSALGNIKKLLLKWAKEHAQAGSCGCMLGTNIADFGTDDSEIAQIFHLHLDRIESLFARAIDQAQQVGDLGTTITCTDLARSLLTLTQGMALIGRVTEDENAFMSVYKVAEQQLLAG